MSLGLLAALVTPLPLGALPSPPQSVGSLEIGNALFWEGEYVAVFHGGLAAGAAYFSAPPESQAANDPCLTGSAFCRLYEFQVTEPEGTLRVALDSSKRGECFAIEVRDPDGKRPPNSSDPTRSPNGFPFVCPDSGLSGYGFNLEMAVPNAAEGKWQVRAMGLEVEDWAFRMRARLEGPRASEPDLLAPNLVPWLPWEFDFVAPANPNAGTAHDNQNPPGPPGVSCHSDEQPAAKCLRFSAGVYNVGDGPLYLAFEDNQAFQHVYYADSTPGEYRDSNEADGRYQKLAAGPAEFHEAHGHRHFADMVLYELFAVSGTSPPPPYKQGARLTRIGSGDKHGFCTASQQFEDWRSFEQDGQWASWPAEGVCEDAMTLERGWGDVYRWQRPGQYVSFDEVADPDGTMRAGLYVVRVTIDPEGRLKETRENDNVGYAYIQVIDGDSPNSDKVVICERGFGKSPWDPSKEITESDPFLWAKLLQDPSFTPEIC